MNKILSFLIMAINIGMYGNQVVPVEKNADSRLASVTMLEIKGAEKSAICSGVYISTSQVLTSAHCFGLVPQSANLKIIDLKFNAETKIFKSLTQTKKIQDDLAIVTFPKALYKGPFFSIQTTPAAPAQKLHAIGYGLNENHVPGEMRQLNFGSENKPIYLDNTLSLYSYSRIASGDSGGPLIDLKSGSLVGISSLYSPHYQGPGANRFFPFSQGERQDIINAFLNLETYDLSQKPKYKSIIPTNQGPTSQTCFAHSAAQMASFWHAQKQPYHVQVSPWAALAAMAEQSGNLDFLNIGGESTTMMTAINKNGVCLDDSYYRVFNRRNPHQVIKELEGQYVVFQHYLKKGRINFEDHVLEINKILNLDLTYDDIIGALEQKDVGKYFFALTKLICPIQNHLAKIPKLREVNFEGKNIEQRQKILTKYVKKAIIENELPVNIYYCEDVLEQVKSISFDDENRFSCKALHSSIIIGYQKYERGNSYIIRNSRGHMNQKYWVDEKALIQNIWKLHYFDVY